MKKTLISIGLVVLGAVGQYSYQAYVKPWMRQRQASSYDTSTEQEIRDFIKCLNKE